MKEIDCYIKAIDHCFKTSFLAPIKIQSATLRYVIRH
jgi:hypothetical protein